MSKGKSAGQFLEFALTRSFFSLLVLFFITIATEPVQAEGYKFSQSLEAAWTLAPERASLEARRNAACARLGATQAWFPDAPSLSGNYADDRVGSNQGYRSGTLDFSTPLWLPGEPGAKAEVANLDIIRIDTEIVVLKLNLASQVLNAAAEARAAINAEAAARQRLKDATALAADLERQFKIGEVAEIDSLAAQADMENAKISVSQADAQASSAKASLQILTGTQNVPEIKVASQDKIGAGSAKTLLSRHPRLVLARRSVDAARASLTLTEITDRDSPTIGVTGTRERQMIPQPFDNYAGVKFTLPFSSPGRNIPRLASAESELVTTQTQLVLQERQLLLELEQAEIQLKAARTSLEAASRAASELEQRSGKIERAWRAGELPLIEVIRARVAAYEATITKVRNAASREVAAARVKLALGFLP